MNAEIVAVGTELLLGQILNTNAQFLSQKLSLLGIDVYFQTVVGDNPDRLKMAANAALGRSDIVIFTGGLGPTQDDLTKEIVCEVLGVECELHSQSAEEIKNYFGRLGVEMPESNLKQAMLPKGCTVLKNSVGTAPGCIIEKGGKTVILLPGPPNEMEPMFEDSVAPYLKRLSGRTIYSRVLRVFGMGESMVEQKIMHLIENQKNPTIATYAKEGEVTIRISAKAESEERAKLMVAPVADEIKKILGSRVYGEGDDTSLPDVVCRMLIERNVTVSVAESCTGGMLAQTLTSYPGISDVFSQAVVTYSNNAKEQYLCVRHETIDRYGAVSEQTAREMAIGMKKRAGSDIAVAITGIAGPGGGSELKPVGLVYIALAGKGNVRVKELHLAGTRERIRRISVLYALDMIREYLR